MSRFAVALMLALPLAGQDAQAFLGRWDITVTPATGAPYPQWMELIEKDGKIEGRLQPRGGAWRPITGVTVQNAHLVIPLGPSGRGGAAATWDFTASGNSLTGIEKRGDAGGPKLAAVR